MTDPTVTQAVTDLSTKMDGALVEIATTLKDAVKQYGPDAVDLALVAFRIDAVQQLAVGALLIAFVIAIAVAYSKLWAWTGKLMASRKPYEDEPYYIARTIGGIVAVIAGGVSMLEACAHLIDASAWMAAFGYPEIRIAMKALAAAGLM